MQGSTEQEQLNFISRLCGSIKPEVWPDVVNLELYNKLDLLVGLKRRIQDRLGSYIQDPNAISLLDKMLILDPSQRIDADTALNHDFFWTDPMPVEIESTLQKHTQGLFEYRASRISVTIAPHSRLLPVQGQVNEVNGKKPMENSLYDRVY